MRKELAHYRERKTHQGENGFFRRRAALAAHRMAIPNRHRRVTGTYFVTSRTWQSRALFVNEANCSVFVDALLHYREKGAYALHAFVVMPDHFHVLLTPTDDVSLERAVQYIKGGSARKLAIEKNLRFPVWQRGFSDHRIRDLADFVAHQRYIWENPVRKKLVLGAREFRWSSAFAGYTLDPAPQGLKPPEARKLALRGTAKAVP
jgi:putative transposase